jgi:hypothetical protein
MPLPQRDPSRGLVHALDDEQYVGWLSAHYPPGDEALL